MMKAIRILGRRVDKNGSCKRRKAKTEDSIG